MLPPPLNDASGPQLFVWDSQVGQIVGASSGQCVTIGRPNLPPTPSNGHRAPWVTNNGTLEHEVWAGPLSSGKRVFEELIRSYLLSNSHLASHSLALSPLRGTHYNNNLNLDYYKHDLSPVDAMALSPAERLHPWAF